MFEPNTFSGVNTSTYMAQSQKLVFACQDAGSAPRPRALGLQHGLGLDSRGRMTHLRRM